MAMNWLDKVIWVIAQQAKRWRTYEVAVFLAKLVVSGTILVAMAETYRLLWQRFGMRPFLPSDEWFLMIPLVILYLLVHSVTMSAGELKQAELSRRERFWIGLVSWSIIAVIFVIIPFSWSLFVS